MTRLQLAEGNINTGQLSIGYPDDRIPPYPGCIDGFTSGGLSNHGRFEGDVSIGRQDHGVGDSVEFQEDRWDMVGISSLYISLIHPIPTASSLLRHVR